MRDCRSDKRPFQSRFGGGFVSPAQFIAETMCERIATRSKQTLPLRFWNTDRWKRDYMLQVRFATALLKLYSYEAIVKALRTPDGKKIYSLGANWLDPLVRVEFETIKRERAARQERPAEQPPEVVVEKPRPAHLSKPSLLNKLRELD